MADETVLLVTRPARIVRFHYYTGAVVLLVLGLGILLTFIRLPPIDFIPSPWLSTGLGLALFGIALVLVLVAEVRRLAVTYVLTSERVLRRDGIVRRKTSFMPYAKLQRVELVQTLRQRLVGVGTLVVDTGEDTMEIRSVRRPAELERMISARAIRR